METELLINSKIVKQSIDTVEDLELFNFIVPESLFTPFQFVFFTILKKIMCKIHPSKQ